jgi:hypothetical protein
MLYPNQNQILQEPYIHYIKKMLKNREERKYVFKNKLEVKYRIKWKRIR